MSPEELLSLFMIIAGVIMLLAEAAAPGNFLVVPATVLLLLGFIGLAFPSILFSWYSPLLAVLILIPTTLLTIKLYQRLAPPAPPQTVVASSLIGRTGVVVTKVTPDNLKGKVKIENDIWSASSVGREIPVGTKVIVTSSEGVHVVVSETFSEKIQKVTRQEEYKISEEKI